MIWSWPCLLFSLVKHLMNYKQQNYRGTWHDRDPFFDMIYCSLLGYFISWTSFVSVFNILFISLSSVFLPAFLGWIMLCYIQSCRLDRQRSTQGTGDSWQFFSKFWTWEVNYQLTVITILLFSSEACLQFHIPYYPESDNTSCLLLLIKFWLTLNFLKIFWFNILLSQPIISIFNVSRPCRHTFFTLMITWIVGNSILCKFLRSLF